MEMLPPNSRQRTSSRLRTFISSVCHLLGSHVATWTQDLAQNCGCYKSISAHHSAHSTSSALPEGLPLLRRAAANWWDGYRLAVAQAANTEGLAVAGPAHGQQTEQRRFCGRISAGWRNCGVAGTLSFGAWFSGGRGNWRRRLNLCSLWLIEYVVASEIDPTQISSRGVLRGGQWVDQWKALRELVKDITGCYLHGKGASTRRYIDAFQTLYRSVYPIYQAATASRHGEKLQAMFGWQPATISRTINTIQYQAINILYPKFNTQDLAYKISHRWIIHTG